MLLFAFSQIDGFSCPRLVKETETLKAELDLEKTKLSTLEEQKCNLEGIITTLKEQHKDYVNSLESENEQSLKYQRESLTKDHEEALSICEFLFCCIH